MESQITLLRRSTLERLLTLASQSQISITRRTIACAAELVEYFANWREFKLANHRTEWIYQPVKRIVEDFMGQFGRWVVRNALEFLLNVGVLSRRRNPGNEQDKTYQYKIDLGVFDFAPSKSKTGSRKSKTGQHQQRSTTVNQSTTITSSSDVVVKEGEERGIDSGKGEGLTPQAEDDRGELKTTSEGLTPQTEDDRGEFKTTSEQIATPPTTDKGIHSAAATEAIFEELEAIGVRVNAQIEQVVRTAELVALTTAIQILKAKRRRGDRLSNPAGFFIRAVRERWKPEPEESCAIAPPGFFSQPIKVDYTIGDLKRMYPDTWRDAAAHFGLKEVFQ